MTSRTAYPPTYHHSTKTISPSDAQQQLAAFLAKTPTNSHLHPDAILSQSGIQFPAQSGPQGGLALHHLRRIEAGLRGENLVAESQEELKVLFASESEQKLPAGDDTRLNALIVDSTKRLGKRARSAEHVEQWQDDTAAEGAVNPEEYALAQADVEEEIGNDTLAGNGEQRTTLPQIQTGGKTDADKAARKAAKKAKKHQEKQKKLEQKKPTED